MDSFVFRLPDVGEGVAEAEIVAWHAKVGDRLEEDQALVDVMTDKATVELTIPVAGLVVAAHGEVGDRVPVGSTLVELDLGGEAAAEPRDEPAGRDEVAEPAPLAAPATRRQARALGVALETVPGTGPQGRITPGDLKAFASRTTDDTSPAVVEPREKINKVRLIGLRRRIAEKMQEAKRRIPHFSYVEEFDLTELEALRRELNERRSAEQPKLTLLPFFMRALVRIIPDLPQVNARFDDEAGVLHSHEGVHIGIATQTRPGLLVPVVRHAEARNLWDCARELVRVTTAAREGRATQEELTGSTITLTSLGAMGGLSATPVINHPEVAIIGPNKLVERPMVIGGQVVVRTMMNVSSSFDHRIIDGYEAAQFIQRLKRLIERPALIFIEGA